jgi:hypothetical protein
MSYLTSILSLPIEPTILKEVRIDKERSSCHLGVLGTHPPPPPPLFAGRQVAVHTPTLLPSQFPDQEVHDQTPPSPQHSIGAHNP